MEVNRRALLIAAAAAGSAAAAPPVLAAGPTPGVTAAIESFAALPATARCLIDAADPKGGWTAGHDPAPDVHRQRGQDLILAQYMRDVEAGRLSESDQRRIDDAVRSPGSPVFLNLTGTTPARSVLEAMIAHSDNTATDVAIAAVGPDAGPCHDQGGRPRHRANSRVDAPPLLFSGRRPGRQRARLAGDAASQPAAPAGKARPAINDTETMGSSAEDMVRWYRTCLRAAFFAKPETFVEFKRIQAMADSLALVVPA